MNRNSVHRVIITAVAGIALFASAAFSQVSMGFHFEEMEPYVGLALHMRVVDTVSLREISRSVIPEIPSDSFAVELSDFVAGSSIRIDVFVDVNGNGHYDTPPLDHAWRVALPEIQIDGSLSLVSSTDFADIGWPPVVDGVVHETEYRSRIADSQTGMTVYSYVLDDLLYIGLSAPGTGWLSIGFDPELRMRGANIIIAAMEEEGLTIEDHYGNSPTSHRRDTTDDIIQAAGAENAGTSVVEFAVPLDSGDDEDKALIAGSEVTIILAYHRTDDRLTTRHSERSTTSIRIGG